ncbi:MAG: ATP-binding cassette domain-containing protein, partial [Actinomycetota bacterium]|nr:ATP-binding cassette domain-containing protein [Actinomycetota bacterium]
MEEFLTLVVSGAVTGAIYSLIAAGLVLTYTTTRIFNFAHAAIAFVVALVYFELNSGHGWDQVPAALFAVFVFAPVLGLVLDRLLFRRLARAPETARIVGTIGLLIALPALALFLVEIFQDTFHWGGWVGTEIAPDPPGVGPVPPDRYQLANTVPIDSDQIIVFVCAAAAALLLWIVLSHTRLGLQMRAAIDRPALAALRGVDDARTSSVAWVLGAILAGLAGIVGSTFPAFALNPFNYTLMLFVAATAAVIGGLRSIPYAFAGGMLIGVIRNLGVGYLEWGKSIPGLRSSAPYFLLFLALFVLARDRSRRAAVSTGEAPPPDYLADLPAWRRLLPWTIATAALIAWVFIFSDNIWLDIVLRGLALGLVFLSFVVVTGHGGMVSLAQTAFVTTGALTAGYFFDRGWPFIPALVVGALAACALGVIVALPSLRLGGIALALSTLALAYIGDQVLFQVDSFRNESRGWAVPRPAIGFLDFEDNRSMAMLLLALLLLGGWIIHNLQRSAWGRAIVAVRSAEPAAATSGVSPTRVKLAIFAISAFIAGLGGVMFASVDGKITNSTWNPLIGLVWLAVAVTFGIRRPGGAVVAGLMMQASPRILSSGFHFAFLPTWFHWNGTTSVYIPQILFGLGAINLARNPDGVLAIVAQRRWERRRRRAPEPSVVVTEVEPAAPEAAVESVLVLDRVRAGYGEVEVLHGVNLAIPTGSVVALLGANGAGKSTLAAVVAGLLPPTAGAIVFEGTDVARLPAHERARAGIMLAPESRGIFPSLSVDDNLALWLPSSGDRDAAYARFPHLAERRKLPAGSLSGGEQQMLTLAA